MNFRDNEDSFDRNFKHGKRILKEMTVILNEVIVTLNVVKTDLKMKINKFQSQKVCLLQTALTFMFMAVSTLSYAQKLKTFTLEDLNFGGNNYHNMIAKNRWTTWWGDQLVRLDTEECYIINKATGKETKLFTLSDLTRSKEWIISILCMMQLFLMPKVYCKNRKPTY